MMKYMLAKYTIGKESIQPTKREAAAIHTVHPNSLSHCSFSHTKEEN
jgi:hypothetical protein